MLTVIFVMLELFLYALIIYTIYKVIWYTIKMLILKSKLRVFKGRIEFLSSLSKAVFHKKRDFDFVIEKDDMKYKVLLITFISNHGRWNIEKTRHGYTAEARRVNKIFYKPINHSGRSDDGLDYRGETRFQSYKLSIKPCEDANTKQIILIYPRPKQLSFTYTRMDLLRTGSVVDGYEVMYLEDLINNLK